MSLEMFELQDLYEYTLCQSYQALEPSMHKSPELHHKAANRLKLNREKNECPPSPFQWLLLYFLLALSPVSNVLLRCLQIRRYVYLHSDLKTALSSNHLHHEVPHHQNQLR